MGKYNLMGVLGLQDAMTGTLKKAQQETRNLKREVLGLDKTLKGMGRVGRNNVAAIFKGGRPSSNAAAALLDPHPEQRIAKAGRVIQMEQRRQQREAEKLARAQQKAEQVLGRQKEREAAKVARTQQRAEQVLARQKRLEQARFEKEAQAFLKRRQQAELAAARHTAAHTAVMPLSPISTTRYTNNPVMRWLQTRMAGADLASAKGALDQAAKSAPRFVEMARAGLTPGHLHGDAMKKRWEQIKGLADKERAATERLKRASQGAIVSGMSLRNIVGAIMPSPERIRAFEQGFTQTIGRIGRTTRTVLGGAWNVLSAPIRALGSLPGLLGLGGGVYGATRLVGGSLDFSANMEQARISFTTLLKSEEKARRFVADLFQFAAKTPYEFPEVQSNARMMMAMGWRPEQILPDMTAIGNAMSALGAGSDVMHRVVISLGQIKLLGKLGSRELRELALAGIPAIDILSQKLGYTKAQLTEAGELAIDSGTALKALLEGMNERYGNGMAMQSRTWIGLGTTIRDYFNMTWGAFGDGIRGKVQPALMGITDWFDKNPQKVADWQAKLRSMGYGAAKHLVDAVEGAMNKIGRLMADPKFQSADFFGKVGMLARTLIGEPIQQWWNTGGREWAKKATQDTVNFLIDAVKSVDWGGLFWESFKKHPVLTTLFTMGGINSLTGGALGSLLGAGALKGAGWLWKALLGTGVATAATSTAATTAAAGGATVAGTASLLGPAALLAGGAVAGGLAGRYVLGPASSKWLQWTDANLPGGNVYTDRRLESEQSTIQALRNRDSMLLPNRPLTPDEIRAIEAAKAAQASKRDLSINLSIVRADNEDDESLLRRLGKLLASELKVQLENS